MKAYYSYLSGYIGADLYDAKFVRSELDKAVASNATDFIIICNSSGGDFVEAQVIRKELLESALIITTHVVGVCASAAHYIAMAGKIKMSPSSQIMSHLVKSQVSGTADEIDAQNVFLKNCEIDLLSVYAVRLNKTTEEVKELLKNDLYLNADEAIKQGFADELLPVIKNINMNTEIKSALAPIMVILNKLGINTKPMTILNGSEPIIDSDVIVYFEGEAIAVDTIVFIDELLTQFAPVGVHVLLNGQTITVGESGLVTEVIEAVNALDVANAKITELENQLNSKTIEISNSIKTVEQLSKAITILNTQVQTATLKIETRGVPDMDMKKVFMNEHYEKIKRQLGN